MPSHSTAHQNEDQHEHELSVSACREAIMLNPNSLLCHQALGFSLGVAGRSQEALEQHETVCRLSPRDPNIGTQHTGRAFNLFQLERYEECVQAALASSHGPNPRYWADIPLVAALTTLGRTDEAAAAKQMLLTRKPDFTLSTLKQLQSLNTESMRAALRKAGIPE